MRWNIHGFFLWSLVCSTEGISAYLPCQQAGNQTTPLREFKNCNLSIENGHLHALCRTLVTFPYNESISAQPLKITMEQLLVSEDTVRTGTQGCARACLSLRRVEFKKWDVLPDNVTSTYDYFEDAETNDVGWYILRLLLMDIRRMTFDVTLEKPPPVAVARCASKRVNESDIFSIYGFADFYLLEFPYPIDEGRKKDFFYLSVISKNCAPGIRVTGLLKEFPTTVWGILYITPIILVAFYRCSIHYFSDDIIPPIDSIQHLEFSQCPFESVDPMVFRDIPSVKNISLTSTNLPGIPEAIFSLKTLIYLNMSNTNVPPGMEFDFRPIGRNTKSSVEQLITSGSNVTVLRDRDLCGFPNLTELHMDGCHLEILEGSPFICLKKLLVLSLQANKIPALNEATLKGLTGLSLLNLNRNSLTVFDGTNTVTPLMSLRVLFARHNRVKKWTPPMFSRMTELKMLDLSHNEIAVLDNEMFRDLNGIENVSLSFNPWDCYSCYLNNLHNFLNNHHVECAGCVACNVPEEQQGYHVRSVAWREEECVPPEYYPVYASAGILSIMLAAMLAYGTYKSRWYFMYVYLYLKVGIKGSRRHVNVGNYAWDAFVSYHASDSDWVHNVLLQELESPPLNFRLCVAARNFIPGILITDNICRAITQSRVCLFILSPAFCRSRWCMFELNLAQHLLSDSEGYDGLVFVKKEEVGEHEMSNMLLLLTRLRTNIKVPPSNATELRNKLFWLQLQAALH